MTFAYSRESYEADAETNEQLSWFSTPADLVTRWYLHDYHGKGVSVAENRDRKMSHVYPPIVPPLAGHGLELGFGFGESLFWLFATMPDITADALDFARTHEPLIPLLKALHGDRLREVWIGDAASVPKPDGHYDWINAASIFEHLPDDAYWQVVTECYRLLKPGGRMGVYLDISPGEQHVRIVSPKQTRRELESVGFRAITDYLYEKPKAARGEGDANVGMTREVFNMLVCSVKLAGIDMATSRMCEFGNQTAIDPQWPRGSSAKSLLTPMVKEHVSVDLNGQDGALPFDLEQPLPAEWANRFDIVTNIGTIEHTNDHYAAFTNVLSVCKVDGIMFHLLPQPEHPLEADGTHHGRYGYCRDYCIRLADATGCRVILDECRPVHPKLVGRDVLMFALQKTEGSRFPDKETFASLPFVDHKDLTNTGNYSQRPGHRYYQEPRQIAPSNACGLPDAIKMYEGDRDLFAVPLRFLWPGDAHGAWRLRAPYLTLLYRVAEAIKPAKIFEIGIRAGYSAHAFLSACPAAKYIGMDLARGDDSSGEPAVKWAKQSLAEAGYATRIFEQSSLNEWPLEITGQQFDLIHVDGGHEYENASNDIRRAWPLLKPGGVMLMDDYDGAGVQQASNEFFGRQSDAAPIIKVSKRWFVPDAYGIVQKMEGKMQERVQPPEPPFEYGSPWYDKTWADSLAGLDGPYTKVETGNTEVYRARDLECLKMARIKPGERILDIGCGPGFVEGLLRDEFHCKDVVGLDFSPVAIEFARKQFPDYRFDTVDLATGSLPYPPQSFDAVLMFDLTEHLPPETYRAMMVEARRVLKRGGRLVILAGQTTLPQHINVLPAEQIAADVAATGLVPYVMGNLVIGHREKRLVVTRSDANCADMAAISHPLIKAYAEKCDAEFMVLDGASPCNVGDGRYHYRVMALYILLEKYDRILHLDTDMLVRPETPNLFDEVPPGCIGTVLEDVGSRKEHRRAMMAEVQKAFGDVGWTEGWCNTGVFIVSSCHRDIFTPVDGKLWTGWGFDDAHIMWQIKKHGFKVRPLDPLCNFMSCYSESWNDNRSRFDAFILHYAGGGHFPDKGNRTTVQLMHDDAVALGLIAKEPADANKAEVQSPVRDSGASAGNPAVPCETSGLGVGRGDAPVAVSGQRGPTMARVQPGTENPTQPSAPAIVGKARRKIALVGVFTPSSTNVPMADGLEQAGCEVRRVPYRDLIGVHGLPGLTQGLKEAAAWADATIICKGGGGNLPSIPPDLVAELHGTTCYWLPDNIEVIGRGVIDIARACRLQCATSLVSCKMMADAGCQSVSQIFEGFDQRVWMPLVERKVHDVVFIGNEDDANRKTCLDAIRQTPLDLQTPKAWLGEACEWYNKGRIVLNFVRGEIFSDRVIHVMASGGFLMTQDCADLRAALDGCYVPFTGPEDLVRKCDPDNWLCDEVGRRDVAIRGWNRVQDYAWHRQMRKLLRVLDGERVADGAFRP